MNKTVLVGGCFDILHLGHIKFLEEAKKLGDKLIVLLESDQRVQELKGESRPINSQQDRAAVLKALRMVDEVVLLKDKMTSQDYDDLVKKLKPGFIATTKGDSKIDYKKRAASQVKAQVVEVLSFIPEKSTTKLLDILLKKI